MIGSAIFFSEKLHVRTALNTFAFFESPRTQIHSHIYVHPTVLLQYSKLKH